MKQTQHNFQKIINSLFLTLVIFTLFALSVFRPAYAAGKGQDFGPAFADSFNDLMNGLREEKCVGQIYGQSLDLTFAGLLAGNIHLSKSQRHNINSVAQEWVRKRYGQSYNISYSQEIGTIAGFGYSDPDELKKTVKHHMKKAPLFLLMRTRRPFIDIIQLEIILFARTKGASLCNRNKSIYLHLPSNKVISIYKLNAKEKGVEGEYIDASQGYLFGIQKIMTNFKGGQTLSFLPSFDDADKCSWHRRETRLFQSQYFALQQRNPSRLNHQDGGWPLFQKLSAQYGDQSDAMPTPVPDSLLVLRWSRVENTPRVVQFTMSLYKKTLLRNTVSYFIVTDAPRYQACVTVKKPIKQVIKQEDKKLQLTIKTFQKQYRIGDKLRFIVSANRACELNIIYRQANGETVLLPYYLNEKPLVGGYFLQAGETRIIPVHPDLNMDITGSVGTERLVVQCKVGGLGKSRINQDDVDRLNQGLPVKTRAPVTRKTPTEKNSYAVKTINFSIGK